MSRSGWLVLVLAALVSGSCAHEGAKKTPPNVNAWRADGRARLPRASASSSLAQDDAVAGLAPRSQGDAIFFDFDSAVLKGDAQPRLEELAAGLTHDPSAKVRVEGNCDQTGTVEYNLALGEERARAAKTYLERLGVRGERISTVSYGSQRPKYPGDTEEERAKNRRDDFVVQR
jgi:peptidoglycan-associated lipoprotein